MATFSVAPTLCTLTYDTDDDRTQYRYPSAKYVDVGSPPVDTPSFSLPAGGFSVSYLEYLRTLYELKATHTSKPTGQLGSGTSRRLLTRSQYSNYTTANHKSYAVSYGYVDSRPKTAFIPHTRPLEPHQQYSLPSLHQGRTWGQEEEESESEGEFEEKVVWIDALNRWIPDPQLQPRNYLSFVGTAPVVAKLYATLKEQKQKLENDPVESSSKGRLPVFCSRYEAHMDSHSLCTKCGLCGHFHDSCPQSLDYVHTHRLVTIQRREALKKKASEAAAEKKQRKAYSTPLYTPLKDKAQKVRFNATESVNVSRVTSPVSEADPDIISLPKESWEAWDNKEGTTDVMATGEETDVPSTDGATDLDDTDEDVSAEDLGYVVVTLEDIEEATEALEEHEAALFAEAKAAADIAAEKLRRQQIAEEEEKERARLAATAAAAAAREEEEARLAKSLHGDGDINKSKSRKVPRGVSTKAPSKSSSDKPSASSVSGSGSGNPHKKMSAAVTKPSKPVSKSSSTKPSKKSSTKLKPSTTKDGEEIRDYTQHTRSQQDSAQTVQTSNQADNSDDVNSRKADSYQNPKSPNKTEQVVKPNSHKLLENNNNNIKSRKTANRHYTLPKVANSNSMAGHKGAGAATSKGSRKKHGEELLSRQMSNNKGKQLPVKSKIDMSLGKPESIACQQSEPRGGNTTDSSAGTTQAVIPTVGDTHSGPLSLTVDLQDKETSTAKSPIERQKKVSVVKRERVGHRRKEEIDTTEEGPVTETRKTDSWIYGDEDFSEIVEKPEESREDSEDNSLLNKIPDLPDPDSFRTCTQSGHSSKRRVPIQTPIVQKFNKLKRRPPVKDTSYAEELRRLELAEKRQQKRMEMLEKMKSKKVTVGWDGDGCSEDGPNFEDYGFLAKYCIFNRSNVEMYRHTFDIVDEEKKGWLPSADVMVALRAVNNKLSESEENYLYRLLEMIGYNVRKGADFKLFSVMAALSLKISALDNWMKNMIGRMDFKMLEMKMFMCKKLWECNVDPGTNKITIDQLCVELRAGGVSDQHEQEVRHKLSHMDDLDLLDFLTYIPLFIMIHQSVVDNPLDDVRDK